MVEKHIIQNDNLLDLEIIIYSKDVVEIKQFSINSNNKYREDHGNIIISKHALKNILNKLSLKDGKVSS